MMDFIAANFNLPTVLIALLVIAGILLAVRSVRRPVAASVWQLRQLFRMFGQLLLSQLLLCTEKVIRN